VNIISTTRTADKFSQRPGQSERRAALAFTRLAPSSRRMSWATALISSALRRGNMRVVQVIGGLGIVILFASIARAEPLADTVPLYQAKVVVDDALVRSGPSMTFYPTNKLRRGELVEVVGEERDGWLKV